MGEKSRGLHFRIEIVHAYFTSPGRYFLKLCIHGTHGNKRKVQLYVNKSKNPLNECEFSTGVCLQDEDIPVALTDSLLKFVLPPGEY